jgi:hypothetical protein
MNSILSIAQRPAELVLIGDGFLPMFALKNR